MLLTTPETTAACDVAYHARTQFLAAAMLSSLLLPAALVLVLVFFIWRLASRRRELPCPVWLRWLVEIDNPFTRSNRAACIIERLELQNGMQVLDAGCGPGRVSLPLARQVGASGSVLAMDMQAGMLQRTQQKAAAAGINNLHYLQARLGEGRIPAGQFDRAVLVTVLGEIPDQVAALREIFAALKPDGLLAVTEVIFDPHFQPRSRVEELAQACGFIKHADYGHALAYNLVFRKPASFPPPAS